MVVPKEIRTKNSHGLISYMLDEDPHSTDLVSVRNLIIDGQNLERTYTGRYDNSAFIESQFYASRVASNKQDKKTQAYHLIFSFSDQEFPLTKKRKQQMTQARQARDLVKGFLTHQLQPEAQYLLAVQRDGEGQKLHVHVALNTVLTDGRTLDTNDLSIVKKHKRTKMVNGKRYTTVPGLFENLQKYMDKHFKKMTGRDYTPVEMHAVNKTHLTQEDKKDVKRGDDYYLKKRGASSWREDLKAEIRDVVKQSDNLDDFKRKMRSVYGVNVKERKASVAKLDDGHKVYRRAFTYQIMGTKKDGREYVKRSVRDFRITSKFVVRGLGEFARPLNLQREIDKRLGIDSFKDLPQDDIDKIDFIDHATHYKKAMNQLNKKIEKAKKALDADANAAAYKQSVQANNEDQAEDSKITPVASLNASEAQNKPNKAKSGRPTSLSEITDFDEYMDVMAKANEAGLTPDEYLALQNKQYDKSKSKSAPVKNTNTPRPVHTKTAQGNKDHGREPELVPTHSAVKKLDTAKRNTDSKKQANSLKKSINTVQNIDAQRVQEQKQKQSEIDDRKKKEKQLKALRRAQLEQEEHNMIQNLPEPWKDNDYLQDEDGFDDF